MVWNYTDKAELKNEKLSNEEMKEYLSKIFGRTLICVQRLSN